MTTHVHPCVVCGDGVPCSGYLVGSEVEQDQHCVREDDGLIVCDEHTTWTQCDWCGTWYDPAVTLIGLYPGLCSVVCANEQDYADVLTRHDHEAAEADYWIKHAKEDAC